MKNKKIKFELNTPFGKFTDEFIIKMYGFTLGLMFGEELGAKLTKIMCDNKKHGLDINSYCFGFSMACAECGGDEAYYKAYRVKKEEKEAKKEDKDEN